MIGQILRFPDNWSKDAESGDTILTQSYNYLTQKSLNSQQYKLKITFLSLLVDDIVQQQVDDLKVTSRTFTYKIAKEVFDSISVDESKCVMYEQAGDTIRIELKMMQTMQQLSEYGDLVDNLLDYIEQGVLMKFSAMNHFSYAFLADLFQVSPICT